MESYQNHEETQPSPHEPSSYWQTTATSTPLSAELPIPPSPDVAIIGGGILGIATCYWLARAGVSVVLLERTMLASGATGRNGGLVSIGAGESYSTTITRLGDAGARQILTLTIENNTLLRKIIADEQIACDYRETGRVTLAIRSDQMADLERSASALQAEGVTATPLDRQGIQHQIATPLGQEIVGGQWRPDGGLVHSSRLAHGLAYAAQNYGAYLSATNVLRLAADKKGVCISTSHGSLHAKQVIVATNAWIGELIPAVAGLITPVRGQALAYVPHQTIFTAGIDVDITPTGEYWQQTVDGTIILGGCRTAAPGNDIGIQSNFPTVGVQAALEQVLPRLFPSLYGLQVAQRWAGVMAFTSDFLPIIDLVKDIPGVWIAGGFSGRGMAFAIRLGQLLAEGITSGSIPVELNPLRLNRDTLM